MNKKKSIYYLHSSLALTQFKVILDEVQIALDAGKDVTILTQDESLGISLTNFKGNRLLFKIAALQDALLIRQLRGSYRKFRISDFRVEALAAMDAVTGFTYTTLHELKQIQYKQVDIGFAVSSSFVTLTRNIDPAITPETRKYLDKFLQSSVYLVEVARAVLGAKEYDEIVLFNGRLHETRPFLRVAQQTGMQIRSCEIIESPEENRYKKVYFTNTLPHDVRHNSELIEENWERSPFPEDEKVRLASEFYDKRRHGIQAGDVAYTKDQELGKLPSNWDPSKKNIVIFNSSEDEFVSIGKEFEIYKLYDDQRIAIQEIATMCQAEKDVHIYLRVHPNLSGIPFSYHTDLYELGKKFSNLTVIAADDPVSSYSLIDNAWKVVTSLGSTIGAEANYWGKPVISLGAAFYMFLDVAYQPKTPEELRSMLLGPLSTKPVGGALKYGYFILHRIALNPTYFKLDYVRDARGRKILSFYNQHGLRSKIHMALLVASVKLSGILGKFSTNIQQFSQIPQ